MKIAIDYSIRALKNRGMSRFVDDLISSSPYEIIALVPRGTLISYEPKIVDGQSFFPFWEQYELPRLCRKYKIDILICPYNTSPIRTIKNTLIVTAIHDFIYFESLNFKNFNFRNYIVNLYRSFVVLTSLSKSDIVLTVSKYTYNNIYKYFRNIKSKIFIIPNNLNKIFLNDKNFITKRENILLTVSGDIPSKNMDNLLNAFALINNKLVPRPRLVVVGISCKKVFKFKKRCMELGISEFVKFEKLLTDNELLNYYQKSKAFIFASISEGFGIPVLEAMASGIPMACSNTTSIPEVAGDCAIYFNPYEIYDIANSIEEVWLANQKNKLISIKGIERSHNYFPKKYKKKTLEFWKYLEKFYIENFHIEDLEK